MGTICSTGKVVQLNKDSMPKDGNSCTGPDNKLSLRAVDFRSPTFTMSLSPFRLTRSDAELILAEAKPGCYSLSHDSTSEVFISQSAGKCVIHHSISKRGSSLFVGGESFKDVNAIIEHFKRHPLGDIRLTEELSSMVKPVSNHVANGEKLVTKPARQEPSSGTRSHSTTSALDSVANGNFDSVYRKQTNTKTDLQLSPTQEVNHCNKEHEEDIRALTRPLNPQIARCHGSVSRFSVTSAGDKDLPLDEPLPVLPEPTGAKPPPLFPRFSTLTRSLSSLSLERTSGVFDMKHAMHQLFKGSTRDNYPSQRRTMKIFFIGQNDTLRERQYCMDFVLPSIYTLCKEFGYGCDVYDSSILHDTENNNPALPWVIDRGIDLLKREIEECKKYQLPVIAMVFLGQKLGPLTFPSQLPAAIYEDLELKLKTKEATDAMSSLYALEKNSLPHCFFLREELTNVKLNEARVLLEELLHIVFSSDKTGEDMWNFYAPGIQKDITAIETSLPEAQFIFLEKIIEDLDRNTSLPSEKYHSQFFDHPDANSYYQLQAKRSELQKDMYNKVSKSDIITYRQQVDGILDYSDKLLGIENLEKVKDIFVKKATMMLCNRSSKSIRNWLHSEILFHTERNTMLQNKYPLTSTLKQTIRAYLEGPCRKPLVLCGGYDHDREVITANITKLSTQIFGECCCVITRYVGRTPDSTSISLLSQSICLQLSRAYYTDPSAVPQEIKELVSFMPILLQLATDSQPLVICLNDVHLVELKGSPYNIFSLFPLELAGFVKVILTGSKDIYNSDMELFKDKNSFARIPETTEESAAKLTEQILENYDRTLSRKQKQTVRATLKLHPTPGLVKVIQVFLRKWHSEDEGETLASTYSECFQDLLDVLEKEFGHRIVQETFNFLTVANMGISETCLLDCVFKKLEATNGYSMFSEVFTKYRIKQLVWTIGEMVHTETLYGDLMIRWADKFYPDYVHENHLSNPEKINTYLLDLANYISEVDNTFRCQETSQQENVEPTINSTYNLSKFNILLPYLLQLKELDRLKSIMFCNYENMLTKLRGTSVSHIIDDLSTSLAAFPNETYLSILEETLQLSSEALTFDPTQFAAQLIARLSTRSYPTMWRETDENAAGTSTCGKQVTDVHSTPHNVTSGPKYLSPNVEREEIDKEIEQLLRAAVNDNNTLAPFCQCLLRPKELSLIDSEVQRQLFHYVKDVRFLFTNDKNECLLAWSSSCDRIFLFNENGTLLKDINGLSVKRIPFTIGAKALIETKHNTIFYDLIENKVIVEMDNDHCYFAVCNESVVAAIKDNWNSLALYNIYEKTCLWEYKAPPGKNFRNVLVSKHGSVGVCLLEDSLTLEEQLLAEDDGVPSYAFSRDEMIILDLIDRKELHKLRLKEEEFFYKVCSVSEDGKYLVHLTEPEKHLLVWNLYTGILLHELEIMPLRLLKLHVSSQGNCIVAVSADSFVRVWDLNEGSSRFVLSEPMRSIRGGYMDDTHCLCMSEDGSIAMHSVKSNFLFSYVVVWDLICGNIIATFTTDFYGLTFEMNPKGDYIATNMPTGIVTLKINKTSVQELSSTQKETELK